MHRKTLFALLAAALAPALSACTSTATPKTAALYAPTVVVTGAQPVASVKPTLSNQGTYPTFGPPITAANRQMDDVEAVRLQQQMGALTASHNAGQVTDAEYQSKITELRVLASTHASEMQTRIGN
jgi:hypothetical protein